ncbi:glycosyltransferase family 1 protein [Plantactinospora sp. S1510]|uniref:Glycosyltransferase family 1 protein n=1 Tax=Plantactinospora alkalitolerans TaxID=2789879 RepID=A0ABS0GUS6_9ACTN|nr:glycosyltransferase [Plantactinospora alkalitolerans]MBF9129945.1 glycosyltransferase family 1 protein [Plantactinospora alkalitolerans]
MRVLIVTAGSLGDVAPYTGLGARLLTAGHRVAIAAPARYADLVTGCGLEFRPIPGDLPALRTAAAGRRLSSLPGAPGVVEFVRLGGRFVGDLGAGIATAAEGGTDLLLLSSTTAPLGYSVAQHHGIPSLGVFLQPTYPTRAFPPILLGIRSLGSWGNRAAGWLGQRLVRQVYADASRRLRARLGLPPADIAALERHAEATGWPITHGFSPAVLPRPVDWRSGLDVVGYWWPLAAPQWRPPAALLDFLAAGPPPVYVGFGSLADTGGELHSLVSRALRRAGVRGVVQGIGAGPHPGSESMRDLRAGLVDGADPASVVRPESGSGSDQVLTVGDVPHGWLFPRMAALVHHAGCGTVAAGLRAGIPAVPVPILADQPFWAARLAALGVSPEVIPFHRISEDRLGAAIRAAVTEPAFGHRARLLADRLAGEDGAGAVVAAVDRLAR